MFIVLFLHPAFLLGLLVGLFGMAFGLLLLGWRPPFDDEGRLLDGEKEERFSMPTFMTDEMIRDMLAGYSAQERAEKLQKIFGKDWIKHA